MHRKSVQDQVESNVSGEEGHTYAYGGGGLIAVIVIVLLLVWLL